MALKKEQILDQLESQLKGAKFRILNEILYRKDKKEINPELFQRYHEGYQEQTKKWPFNPLNKIIGQIKRMDSSLVIADLGCGTAEIAKKFPKRKIHSFDLVKPEDNPYIIQADIRNIPLPAASVDVAIFCLSLMGEHIEDYIQEAYRILKPSGILKIAEVRSRLQKIESFTTPMKSHGFTLLKQDLESNYFCFFDFKKTSKLNKRPSLWLKPCVYKKR
ncbi:ribosomal RNA-processing protein 8 [Nematocida sp. AWRm80]|nr:ribosomal RNA-processing protein 8 [Nematocida sp. AWRm80]